MQMVSNQFKPVQQSRQQVCTKYKLLAAIRKAKFKSQMTDEYVH